MTRRVRLLVKGRVQGVGFRFCCRAAAVRLGLSGWVRNLPGGMVEAVAEGPGERILDFIAWCRRGPPGSYVKDVKIIEESPGNGADSFEVRL